MKLLVTGDFHRDLTSDGYDRYDEVTRAINQTVECALDEHVDGYVFLGDLTDPDVDESRAHRAIADTVEVGLRLKRAQVRSYWLVGNHDVMEDGRGSHTLMALARAGLDVFDRPVLEGANVTAQPLLFLPYTSRSHRYDPAEFVRKLKFDATIAPIAAVFGHCTRVPGLEDGSETTDMARGRDLVFPLAELRKVAPEALLFNGHYHRRHVDTPVMTPGSLARCTFGEVDFQPGWLMVEL